MNSPPVRICLQEADDELGELYSPCLCTGSVKYVHPICLSTWLSSSYSGNRLYQCITCNYTYQFNGSRWRGLVEKSWFSPGMTFFLIGLIVIYGSWIEFPEYFSEPLFIHYLFSLPKEVKSGFAFLGYISTLIHVILIICNGFIAPLTLIPPREDWFVLLKTRPLLSYILGWTLAIMICNVCIAINPDVYEKPWILVVTDLFFLFSWIPIYYIIDGISRYILYREVLLPRDVKLA